MNSALRIRVEMTRLRIRPSRKTRSWSDPRKITLILIWFHKSPHNFFSENYISLTSSRSRKWQEKFEFRGIWIGYSARVRIQIRPFQKYRSVSDQNTRIRPDPDPQPFFSWYEECSFASCNRAERYLPSQRSQIRDSFILNFRYKNMTRDIFFIAYVSSTRLDPFLKQRSCFYNSLCPSVGPFVANAWYVWL